MRQFLAGWASTITYVWHCALFFLPRVYTSDAVILTVATFAIVNMIASLTRHADETPSIMMIRTMRVGSILIASAILSLVFFACFNIGVVNEIRTGGPDFVGAGYFVNNWVTASFAFRDVLREMIGSGTVQLVIGVLAMFGSLIAIPLLPAFVIYGLLRTTTPVRSSVVGQAVARGGRVLPRSRAQFSVALGRAAALGPELVEVAGSASTSARPCGIGQRSPL